VPPFPLWVPFCNLSSNSAVLHSHGLARTILIAVLLFPLTYPCRTP
jgi:hypothetical protein